MLKALPFLALLVAPALADTSFVGGVVAGNEIVRKSVEETEALRRKCHELTDKLAYRRDSTPPAEITRTLEERAQVCAAAYPEPRMPKEREWPMSVILFGAPVALLSAFALAKAWDNRRARRGG